MLNQKELKLLETYFSSGLTREKLEILKHHNSMKQALTPLGLKLEAQQTPASQNKIFTLQRIAMGHYLISSINGNANSTPEVNGRFLFVILFSDPARIYCGKAYAPINRFISGDSFEAKRPESHSINMGNVFSSNGRFEVEGHTSLTKCQDVLFAGDLLFRCGILLSWTNASGHYQPMPALRHTNLYPNIKRLLPENLFQEYDFERLSVGSAPSGSGRFNNSCSSSNFSSFSSFGFNNSRDPSINEFGDS
ncbi:hypothetical protein [Ewingella americana]